MAGKMDVAAIAAGLSSDSESQRKLAAFHLQSLVADAEFADAFVHGNGMPALNYMIMKENGNTLAYALGSMNRLLELDFGWEQVGVEVAERAVQLVIDRPVVNVLRNAFRFLVLVVERPYDQLEYPLRSPDGSGWGPNIESLKPILKEQVNFLDVLIEKLSSADHALCGNALQFLNALIRDGILTFSETQLMRFVKRLQDLEIFSTVEDLMRGDSLADLIVPVIDFQTLTKVMLRCWRYVPVDLARGPHNEALVNLRSDATRLLPHKAVLSRKDEKRAETNGGGDGEVQPQVPWSVLGFGNEDPAQELEHVGLLGLMDLADFVRKNNDFFTKTLLEQSVMPEEQRCPIARVSATVTQILYEQFEIGDSSASPRSSAVIQEQVHGDIESAVMPLLLCRDRLHGAVTLAFFRAWTASEATLPEYHKVESLIRLLVKKTIGRSSRQSTTDQAIASIDGATLPQLRKWQLAELDTVQETSWGDDLSRLRERLHQESTRFIREQRIRCLLQGAWFPTLSALTDPSSRPPSRPGSVIHGWRFIQLAPGRRYLHHAAFSRRSDEPPALSELQQRIDVEHISSVVSNTTRAVLPDGARPASQKTTTTSSSTTAAANKPTADDGESTVTRLLIQGSTRASTNGGVGGGFRGSQEGAAAAAAAAETPLLELHVVDRARASEWLDGLLMLLDQEPITAETERLVGMVEGWSLKVRLLGLGDEVVGLVGDGTGEVGCGGLGKGKGLGAGKGKGKGKGKVNGTSNGAGKGEGEPWPPSREGLDGEYWYDMGEGS